MISRKNFIKMIMVLITVFIDKLFMRKLHADPIKLKSKRKPLMTGGKARNLGLAEDGFSDVYKVTGGSPERNMLALIDRLGGVEKIAGKKDIVILKPNAQWTKQGMTNTDAMKAFMELILNSGGFKGEIIIAENHQYLDFNGRGWSTDQPNGSYNYNGLIEYFNKKGFRNVSAYHWRCAGSNPEPLQGDDDGSGGRRVKGPADGDGYVWRDDIIYISPEGKHCWMTYPVFTSKYSGITIDLKNGAWKNGRYLNDRRVKFINFSALNHHGFYSGVTASVKNLMGVVDMTCGYHAPTPEGTYNVHYIGIDKFFTNLYKKMPRRYLWKIPDVIDKKAHENFHYTGGALGKFMRDIRFPDLNIITAHWVGWGSRWDVQKSSYPKALLASIDPIALDYIAAKDILVKETPANEKKLLRLNNPDAISGPFCKFLIECHRQGIGNIREDKIRRINIVI